MGLRRDAQHRLRALAHQQAGYVSAGQAVEAGFTHQAQKYHVDHGSWVRAQRGIFRLRDWPSTIEGPYALWSRGRGVASHDTATVVHDVGVLNPTKIHLTVPPGFRARHPTVVTTVAVLTGDDVEDRGTFRVTTLLRTLLDIAASSSTTQEWVDGAVVEALDREAVTPYDLRARSDAVGGRGALRIERAVGAAGY